MSSGYVSRSAKTIYNEDGTTRSTFNTNLYKLSTFVPSANYAPFRQRLGKRAGKLTFTLLRFEAVPVTGGYHVTVEWEYTARNGGSYVSDGVGQLARLIYGANSEATAALVRGTSYFKQHYHPQEPRISYGTTELWPDGFDVKHAKGTLPRVFGKMPDGRIVAVSKLTPDDVQNSIVHKPDQLELELEPDPDAQVEVNPEGRFWS